MSNDKRCPTCGRYVPAHYTPEMKCVPCVALGPDRNQHKTDAQILELNFRNVADKKAAA